MVNIKVAVRIRPLSIREIIQNDTPVVNNIEKCILVTNPKVSERFEGIDSRQRIRRFDVDYCYDPTKPGTATQEAIYEELGREVIEYMITGYNACVLAYGHSASGKTYTMMGTDDDEGLTPRICRGIFQHIQKATDVHQVLTVSFLEIYNEKVRDLLAEDGCNFSLRVREHPQLGPYVQALSEHEVESEEDLLELLQRGNKRRSTSATESNSHSSRSHAVFTLRLNRSTSFSTTTSKVHLVDLAGSERAGSIKSRVRLKEGANINKSLVTLGNVISALADSCEASWAKETKNWQPYVPFRDSVLTWLLKDTLGGNSNTIMIATVSPAGSCYSDTINTLRYAKRTKKIVNQPIVNEDPKIRTIRELKEEVARLKSIIDENDGLLCTKMPASYCAVGLQTEDVDRERNDQFRTKDEGNSQGIPCGYNCGNETNASRENGGATESRDRNKQGHRFVLLRKRRIRNAIRQSLRRNIILKMHRNRPDLIKNIKGNSASAGPPLSQSTSETSLNSTGQQASVSRTSSIGEASGSSTPTPVREKKRQEVVAAVTNRLYAVKKKPDSRTDLFMEKETDCDNEQEEAKLKRTRMKLFDLSRKLAMTRRPRISVSDNVVQTENVKCTLRMKEKGTLTDMLQVVDLPEQSDAQMTINQIFVPSGRFILDCGSTVRLESSLTANNSSQTDPLKSEQATSTTKNYIPEGDDLDDICDDQQLRSSCPELPNKKKSSTKKKRRRYSTGCLNLKFARIRPFYVLQRSPVCHGFYKCEQNDRRQAIFSSNNKLTSTQCSNSLEDTSQESDCLSSDTSLNSLHSKPHADCQSSSGTSSEEFIFYENLPFENSASRKKDQRELYTISESNEIIENGSKEIDIDQQKVGSDDSEKREQLVYKHDDISDQASSNESLTFVYLGPKLKETSSMLMEIIKLSLESHKKPKLQQDFPRSISIDTAMNALNNAVKSPLKRSVSLDLHEEKACQIDFQNTLKYSTATHTVSDKEIITDQSVETQTEREQFFGGNLVELSPVNSNYQTSHFQKISYPNEYEESALLLEKSKSLFWSNYEKTPQPLRIDCASQTFENIEYSNINLLGDLIKETASLIQTLKSTPSQSNVENTKAAQVQTDAQRENRTAQTSAYQTEYTLKMNSTWPRRMNSKKPPNGAKVSVVDTASRRSKTNSISSNSDYSFKDDYSYGYRLDLQTDLEESCRRLEEAVQRDRFREEMFYLRTKTLERQPRRISPRQFFSDSAEPISFSSIAEEKKIKVKQSDALSENFCKRCETKKWMPLSPKCGLNCDENCRSTPSNYLRHLVALRRKIVTEDLRKEI